MSENDNSIMVLDFGVTTQKIIILDRKSPHTPISSQIMYFPLEKKRDKFNSFLKSLLRSYAEFLIRNYVITISAGSVFNSAKEAITFFGTNLCEYINSPMLHFYAFDNEFIHYNEALKKPLHVLSTDWWALGTGIASFLEEDALIVDYSTRTTEIVPIREGSIAIPPMTDHERIKENFLLFNGMLETNAAFVMPKLEINNQVYNLPDHYHANMADIFLITKDITPPTYIVDTPDGGKKNRAGALTRLKKMLCIFGNADEKFLLSVAEKIKEKALKEITTIVKNKINSYQPKKIVVAGLGEDILYEWLLKKDLGVDIIRASNLIKTTESSPAYFIGWLFIKQH